jgi:hypothetical protein
VNVRQFVIECRDHFGKYVEVYHRDGERYEVWLCEPIGSGPRATRRIGCNRVWEFARNEARSVLEEQP